MPALLDKDASRDGDEEALSPRSSSKVTSRDDGDDDAASPLDDEPGRAASHRSLPRRLSSSRREDEKPDANESLATGRTLVLKGHTGFVTCLAALEGDRLASGGYEKSNDNYPIIIWNVANGEQLAKLEGHKAGSGGIQSLATLDGDRLASGGYDGIAIWNLADGIQLTKLEGSGGVNCLAAIDGIRLASVSWDGIIVWNLADGTQLTMLDSRFEGHKCLAALDGDRLASGGGAVVIWNLADGEKLATFDGHTEWVTSLAALDDDRLASGSSDESIIIWHLADGTQLAKLEGYEGSVWCLAALDSRLASGSADGTIRVWHIADSSTEPVVMWGQKGGVDCLVALDDGRLVSGGSDGTVRIQPVNTASAAACQVSACGSAFEFEEVARECRDNNALDDLLDAVDHHIDNNKGSAESASAAITLQAHVFDAIAKVLNEEKDAPRKESINSLATRVLDLVRDDALLPEMTRRGVSNAAIQELAPSPLFRVVLDAKFAAGPVFVLYFELFLFVLLGCCFTRVAAFEVLGVSKWFAAEKIVEIVVAFVILAYFSARELYQIVSTRAIELATPWMLENPLREHEGLAWYALAIPRYFLLFVACLPFLPILLVVFGLQCAGNDPRDYKYLNAFYGRYGRGFEDEYAWFGKHIGKPIIHDPLTFLGFSRAWRYDYWNLIDAATIGCAWAAFVRAAIVPGRHLSTDLAVATSLLMWVRFCWYLKNMRLGWAKFVLMIEQIAYDLREYLLFFLVVLLMFASAFYLYIGPRKSADFGFHDDGAPNAFRNFGYTVYNLILLGFVGDFDADNFDKVVLRVLLVFYIIVVIVIFLNVLIAIVSDSYDLSMAKAEGLYLRSRLELITETAPIASRLPKWMLPTNNKRSIKKSISDALDDAKKDKADDPNRLNYTINAVEAIVDNRTRKLEAELAATRENLEAKIDKLTDMIQALLEKDQ